MKNFFLINLHIARLMGVYKAIAHRQPGLSDLRTIIA